MILCFSGTGNSTYVSKVIQSITGDEIISINDLIKKESKEIIKSEKPFVFICPTYAWKMPRVVENFIRKTQFQGTNKVYFVLTCGLDTGNAAHYIKKLCEEKGFELKGFTSILMPENYITMYNAPAKEEANKIIQKSGKKISSIGEKIKENKSFQEEKIKLKDKIKSGIVNSVFYPVVVSAKGFYSTDDCISCGKCVKLCSLNNIELVNGKSQWGEQCTHCMACICRCPKEAIEYKNKTKGKQRYYNSNC